MVSSIPGNILKGEDSRGMGICKTHIIYSGLAFKIKKETSFSIMTRG